MALAHQLTDVNFVRFVSGGLREGYVVFENIAKTSINLEEELLKLWHITSVICGVHFERQ
jgi:hypothetical protein